MLTALPLILAACATSSGLTPTQTENRVVDDPSAAVVSTGGVELLTRMDAWKGEPDQFDDLVPVLVTITNDGETELRIRHGDFALVTASGVRTRATAPFDLDAVELTAVDTALAPYSALGYNPVYWPFGFHSIAHTRHTGFGRFGGLFGGFGPGYALGAPYAPFRRIPLPTADMIAKSLPERNLAPGERVTGFVFFHEPAGDLDGVRFEAQLVAADTSDKLATLEIPFGTDRPGRAERAAKRPQRAIDDFDAGAGIDTPAASRRY